MNIRIIFGYRTVSGIAAGMLAGVPPLDIVARGHAKIYEWKKANSMGRWSEIWPPDEMRQKMMDYMYEEWESNTEVQEGDVTSVRLRQAMTRGIKQ